MLAACLVALTGRAVYGPAHTGYDAAWSLVWGRDLAAGRLPVMDAPIAPTPHPLSNALAAAASLADADASISIVLAATWLAYGVLGVAAFAAGRLLGGVAVGGLAAALLLTRPLLVGSVKTGSLDVLFLAFVAVALVLALREPRPSWPPLVVLVGAGWLRPEAWLLAVVWALIAGVDAGRGRRLLLAGLAVAGPLGWAATDLALTGEPLFSFTGTRELADELERPQSLGRASGVAGPAVLDTLGVAGFLAGVAGLLAAAISPARRPRIVAGLVVLGVTAFLAYGAAGLPVLVRYTFIALLGLTLLAAWAMAGWVQADVGSRRRRVVWAAGAVVLAAAAITQVPETRDRIDAQAQAVTQRALAYDALRSLVRSPPLRRDLDGCPVLLVPNHRAVPLVALWTGRSAPAQVAAREPAVPPEGIAVVAATPLVASIAILDPRDLRKPPDGPPPGWEFRGGNAGWAWYRQCGLR